MLYIKSEEMTSPSFISSKRALSMDPSTIIFTNEKTTRQSTDDEIISSQQDQQ